ncbi:MAG: hypothetical protein K2N94_02085, partial [Lachnospiraceae bacterium]|nr:hypothetical protein [Lachnospiraceae bacterium]
MEVIVSMMILSITVLALLGGFMLSLRLNMKSRSSMSATIVAQNVMECVKEYARAHVVQDGAMKSGVSEEEMKKLLPESYRDGFQVPGDGSIGFRLGGVREGMNEFDVVVSYDRSSYTDGSTGINDYKLPDLTALDSDRTVIVCPPGVTDGSLRRAAESAFYDSWLALQWALHADDEEEYDGPTSVEVSNERAYISANMTAELTIEMEQKLDGSYTGAAELNYCLGGSQHMSYRSEIAFDPPEPGEKPNLYLFYEPVQARALESGGFWIEDKIIVKNCFLEWNLFLAVQETAECLGGGTGGALRLAGPVLEQAPFSSGSKITVYSNSVPDWSAGGGGMFENGNSHDDKGFLFP